MKRKTMNQVDSHIVAQLLAESQSPAAEDTTVTSPAFDQLKRDLETALASGQDATQQLYDLSAALCASVLRKCLDPQRKTAVERDTVSNSAMSPVLQQLRRDIWRDLALLDNTRYNAIEATDWRYNADGNVETYTDDHAALEDYGAIIGDSIGDGLDIVHAGVVALLEQAAEHAEGPGWLDKPHTVRRLDKRVYLRLDDSAAYRDEETTPIQEAYRAIREMVEASRSVKADPTSRHTYVELPTPDDTDRIYYRAGRYANVGGYDSMGNYTAGLLDVVDYKQIIDRLDMTPRQRDIIEMRMAGYGDKAIATYYGITKQAVQNTVTRIQRKAEAIGFTPSMWREMTGQDIDIE